MCTCAPPLRGVAQQRRRSAPARLDVPPQCENCFRAGADVSAAAGASETSRSREGKGKGKEREIEGAVSTPQGSNDEPHGSGESTAPGAPGHAEGKAECKKPTKASGHKRPSTPSARTREKRPATSPASSVVSGVFHPAEPSRPAQLRRARSKRSRVAPLRGLSPGVGPSRARPAVVSSSGHPFGVAFPEIEPDGLDTLAEELLCPDCREDPPNLHYHPQEAETTCASCGLVLSDREIDPRAEWRSVLYEEESECGPSRVGPAPDPLRNGAQLEARADRGRAEAAATALRRAQRLALGSLAGRPLVDIYQDLNEQCHKLRYDFAIADAAKHIYKAVHGNAALHFEPPALLLRSCIYVACRENDSPKTYVEAFAGMGFGTKQITITVKRLQDQLKVIRAAAAGSSSPTRVAPATSAADLCRRFAYLLNLESRVAQVAVALAKRADAAGVLRRRIHHTVAASCVYFAAWYIEDGPTINAVAAVAWIGSTTVKAAYRLLYASRATLIDPAWQRDGEAGASNLPVPDT
ncbi:transcription initiation factor IIB [Ascosphaera acerosa]|nr:transcription initiation factor IIB [Ascosphaera acerosa]